MNNHRIHTVLLTIGLALGVNAWAAQGEVTESTDPAKAAAVEKTAREMKERAAQEARSGQHKSSANIVRGQSDKGLAYLSGGISIGDRTTMYAERGKYSLWVATVAKGSGAYLADAHLRIVTVKGQAVVLDRIMDGPWLFAALPPGRYDVSATLQPEGPGEAQTLTTRVNIARSGQRQAVLRFNSSAKVSPEMNSPFKGNPFGKPPVGQ